MDQDFPSTLNVIGAGADSFAAAVQTELAARCQTGALMWLSPNYAFDLSFCGDAPEVLSKARALAGSAAIDINTLPAANRRKRLLLADMDSTIINCEVLDEIAGCIGLKAETAAVTERAMRGEIDFVASLRERLALLRGLPLHRLVRVYGERVRLNPGARALIATMKKHGAFTMLVSGGFTYFTSRVAEDLGFDDHRGNVLLDDGETLLGAAAEPILGREAKLTALFEIASKLRIEPSDAVAVGDGANDLDMIGAAGLGVAWHAKPIVAEAANARIDHANLKALLYLQGYSDAEIIAR